MKNDQNHRIHCDKQNQVQVTSFPNKKGKWSLFRIAYILLFWIGLHFLQISTTFFFLSKGKYVLQACYWTFIQDVLDIEITMGDLSGFPRFTQMLVFSQALDSMVDVKICWRIWGICLVSMATKERPAGKVLWSLDVGEREKIPPYETLAMQMSIPSEFLFLHVGDNGCLGGGALIRYGVLKKICWLRGAESKVPPVSFYLAAAPPFSLIIPYCQFVSFKRKHMLFKSCWSWKDHHSGAHCMPSSSPHVPFVSQDQQNPPNNANNTPLRVLHKSIDSLLLYGSQRSQGQCKLHGCRSRSLITFSSHYVFYGALKISSFKLHVATELTLEWYFHSHFSGTTVITLWI